MVHVQAQACTLSFYEKCSHFTILVLPVTRMIKFPTLAGQGGREQAK